jgi:hypothetical protein
VGAVLRGRGVSGDRDSFIDRHFLRPAQEWGDWDALADGLERFPPTPAIWEFIFKVLRGEVKRKKKRPPSVKVRTRYLEIAAFVFDLRQKGIKDFIRQASEFFEIDAKAVGRAVKGCPQMDEELASFVLKGSPKFRHLPKRISVYSGPPVIITEALPVALDRQQDQRPRRARRSKGQ